MMCAEMHASNHAVRHAAHSAPGGQVRACCGCVHIIITPGARIVCVVASVAAGAWRCVAAAVRAVEGAAAVAAARQRCGEAGVGCVSSVAASWALSGTMGAAARSTVG